jgi:superfamily II DNA or RNA helicase
MGVMETNEAVAPEGNQSRRRTEPNGARPLPAAPRLRPYQIEAQQAILEHRARGVRSQIVSLATGLGKCVDPRTWVWSNGLRRFEDAWGSDRIAGPHRTDTVVAWYDDGVNPGRRILTEAGLEIDGTLAHRLWIRRDDGYEGWCRLEDLAVGDFVAIGRGRADFGTTHVPVHSAYLLGLAIADGSVVKTGPNAHRLQIDGSPEILARVASTMDYWREKAGGQRNGTVTITQKSVDHAYAIVQAKRLKEYIESTFGVRWSYSPERVVPDAILHGTRDSVRAFLRGYFDGDGTANPIVACNTASRTLAEQIQQLLLGLGVFCGLRTRTSTAGLPSHMVCVYDVEAFDREVGFTRLGRVKDRYFDATLAKKRNPNHDVVPGVGALVRELAARIPAKYRSDHFRTMSAYYERTGWRRPSYQLLRRWLTAAPQCPEALELQRIVDEHRAWTPVTSIEPSAIRRIDAQVDDSHAFIGNGIINHNTVVLATLPKLLSLRNGDVTLVVAHRDELIEQTVDKMRAENPDAIIGIEKAERRAPEDANIVVATVQTLSEKRLETFVQRFHRRIALFVIDEAHHAAAPSYRAIVDAILAQRPEAMVLGFTATPNRGDGVRLVDVFEKIVYSMDARKAIDAGYLVPVKSYAVATTTNLDDIASRGGDFVIGQLAAAVNTVDRNARIVAAYKQHTPGLKALVFTASVEHARDVAEEFVAAGVRAEWASGETPKDEREKIVRDFRNGDCDVLVNCGLYLEGFDVPSVQVILNARPTKSTTLYTQITGRALRPVEEIANQLSSTDSALMRRELIEKSPKPAALIIDFVDQAQRHQLVTLPSLYGLPPQIDAQGRMTAQVAEKFEELLRRDPKRAAKVRSAEEIETALLEIDGFAAPKEIKPTWAPLDPDHWRMILPPQRIAWDKSGRPIPNFGQQWDQWVTEARRIAPHEDAERFATRMLNVNPKTVKFDQPRIDVRREGEEYLTLYTTDELPDRVIDRNKSLPGALGNAYERVKEILSGYMQIGGPPPRPQKNGKLGGSNGHVNGHRAANVNGAGQHGSGPPRRKRGRRARAGTPAPKT